jgi:hypothetical protein
MKAIVLLVLCYTGSSFTHSVMILFTVNVVMSGREKKKQKELHPMV